jgi:hypothetical protein
MLPGITTETIYRKVMRQFSNGKFPYWIRVFCYNNCIGCIGFSNKVLRTTIETYIAWKTMSSYQSPQDVHAIVYEKDSRKIA